MKKNTQIDHQGKLIQALNSYCRYHQVALTFNESGICNGLCTLRTKYSVQNKPERFAEILEEIATMRPGQHLSDELQFFITELMLTAEPKQFGQKLNQNKALELVSNQQLVLKPSFEINLVTSEANWVDSLRQLNLQAGETLTIDGYAHIVSVLKYNNQYSLYDPNRGFALYNTEEELLQALRLKVFVLVDRSVRTSETLAFRLRLISNALKNPTVEAAHRNPSSFYARYADKSTLDFALGKGANLEVIEQLVALGCPVTLEAITQGILSHASEEGVVLLLNGFCEQSVLSVDQLEDLMMNVMWFGSKGMLDLLLKDRLCRQVLLNIINKPEFSVTLQVLLEHASTDKFGKVLSLWQEQLDDNQRQSILKRFFSDMMDLSAKAINAQVLKLLLDEAANLGCRLTPLQNLKFLSQAIQANDYPVVAQLLYFIPPEQINALRIPLARVKQTNLPVLKLLADKGVTFSNNAQAVIAQKEHKWVNLFRIILLVIEQLIDFLRPRKDIYSVQANFLTTQKSSAQNTEKTAANNQPKP